MRHFTQAQKLQARNADLHSFLIKKHGSQFKIEGNSLRMRSNHSISIKAGYHGYVDFATGETGNSIDFLVNHLGYQVDDAIFALVGDEYRDFTPVVRQETREEKADFPEKAENCKNLYAYLLRRGISQNTVNTLLRKKLMYQSQGNNNIVFINSEKDWGELRGTRTDKPFHGIVRNSRQNGFWEIKTSEESSIAYVCESAIDAISLLELHSIDNEEMIASYISIGGVAKQPAIDRIKNMYKIVILAVDNDTAGQECRDRNADCRYIIPKNKDWNDDLRGVRREEEDIF